MAPRLPPLTGLKAFVTAARVGSFLKAAEELYVTPAAVSRSIRSLEDYLACALFHRSHRQVTLTEEGQAYLSDLGDVFDRIAFATQNLVSKHSSRPLVVCAYPSFTLDWLIPRWSRSHNSDTSFALKLVTTLTRDLDFEASGIDLALLSDRSEYHNCICEPLFTAHIVPICAPDYLPPGVGIVDLEDWQGNLLHAATRPNDWARWGAANCCEGIATTQGHVFESSKMMYEAVIAKLGIGVGLREVLARELAFGNLVIPFEDAVPAKATFYMVYPMATAKHPLFAAFREWIRAEVCCEETELEKVPRRTSK